MQMLQCCTCYRLLARHCCLLPGTILKLGTKVHHDQLLQGIDDLGAVGCFALTELGYGMYFHSDASPLLDITTQFN